MQIFHKIPEIPELCTDIDGGCILYVEWKCINISPMNTARDSATQDNRLQRCQYLTTLQASHFMDHEEEILPERAFLSSVWQRS
jgi:hypothetical protein